MSNIKIGDKVICVTSGVVGIVIKRAEAVSEFAERLKKSHDILDVNGYSVIGVDIVELIAEKMKGENE